MRVPSEDSENSENSENSEESEASENSEASAGGLSDGVDAEGGGFFNDEL